MAKRKPTSSESAPAPVPSEPAAQEYTVLARRYRPQQFADLVGQEPVVQALRNALASNRVAHAYLFTGARGVGKTSTARILAKALNCVNGPTADPCGVCEACRAIATGEDVDVLEIDGASNRGIDEVREIRQNVQYRPTRSRYKIYIVDEVHMLTAPAFNALLKTLEEPPPHVKFIFATTEVQKIPITILSRCQRFDFAGIGMTRIIDRLREVVAGEKMEADDDALELIARRAGGSMRDAQSLLDQVLAFGGERLTTQQIHQLLGTAHDDRILDLASAVLKRDTKQALGLLGQAADEGLQLGELLDQLMEYWRDLMVVKCAGADFGSLSVPPRHREALAQQATALNLDTILAGLDVLETTKARLRGSSHSRVLMEMALVRLCRLEDLLSLSQLAQSLAEPSANEARSAKAEVRQTSPSRPPAVTAPPEALKKKLMAAFDADTPRTPEKLGLTTDSVPQIWKEVVSQAGPFLGKALSCAELPAIFGPNTLVIRFPSGYNSDREHCQQPANIARVEEVLRKLTGQSISLRIELASGDARTPQSNPRDDADSSPSRYRRQRSEAMKDPLVKRAMEVLGAQMVEVDDGFGSAPVASAEVSEMTENEES
jgi:DNA polymerase-3 subunit gamma/tau